MGDRLELLWRTACLCVALAGAETLHGIVRTVWLVPRIGKARALRLSIVTGTALAFGVCWLLVPGLRLGTPWAHGLLGLVLSLFMAAFDIAMGRWVMRRSWTKIWPDFDPRTGNLLVFGLAALMVIPSVVAVLRGLVTLAP